MAKKTSSLSFINGDKPQYRGDKLQYRIVKAVYYILNRINNFLPNYHRNNSLIRENLIVKNLNQYWTKCNIKSSPCRKLSDIFWMSLPWNKIEKELLKINIIDAGCGSGSYGSKINDWSEGRVHQYIGIDFQEHDNWQLLEKDYSNFRFLCFNVNEMETIIPEETNFFMSQSAIEHFKEDLTFFKKIQMHVIESTAPIIQFHLFPSSACLKLYGLHGYRQYSPRTIHKIWCLFRKFSSGILFELGSHNCNQLHWEYITQSIRSNGIDLRDSKTDRYDSLLKEAVVNDFASEKSQPSFYALCIQSNFSNLVF